MTDVTGTTLQAAPQAKTTATESKAKISGDYEMFLKMLTTQMQNQDPLNPIESSDYAVQLATFSGVEQQVRTNELLEALAGQLGANSLGGLAEWVGKQVRAPAPAYHDGNGIQLHIAPPAQATRTELIVTDHTGRALGRSEIAPMEGALTWPFQVGQGENWPAGTYGFRLESWEGDTKLGNDAVEVYAPVIEAQKTETGTQLVLAGGATIKADQVSALRASGY